MSEVFFKTKVGSEEVINPTHGSPGWKEYEGRKECFLWYARDEHPRWVLESEFQRLNTERKDANRKMYAYPKILGFKIRESGRGSPHRNVSCC